MMLAGFSLLTRCSDGSLNVITYHPRRSTTWIWGVSLTRKQRELKRVWSSAKRRTNQWHDMLKLPFGWALIWSRQDYHIRGVR